MTSLAPNEAPSRGFANPVFDSQRCFRAVMTAMARPGQIQSIEGIAEPPAPLNPVAAAVAITLFDETTPLWLDSSLAESPAVCGWLAFHSGAPVIEDCASARFALAANPLVLPPLSSFSTGSDRYPDRSTTLILQIESLGARGPRLTGPGIASTANLSFAPMPLDFWSDFARNRALFPCGVDIVLGGPRCLAALPRSTRVAPKPDENS